MAQDDDKGHYGKKALDKLHDKVKALKNGACLTGHEGDFSNFGKKVSCNYRWQAYEEAKANTDISDRLHGYSTRLRKPIQTSAPTGKNGRYPAHYCAELKPPKADYWHIGGPPKAMRRGSFSTGPVTIPATKNFTQDTWPYWNNAHHLIPKGTLKARILQEKPTKVSDLIQQCLLEAKYNINFGINMLLLPQDREVANILDVPRHLQLEDGDGNVKTEVANHPVYNKMVVEVDDGLNKIVKSYARTCKNALKKGHKKPKGGLDKEKLHDLSEAMLDLILNWTGPLSLDANARAAGF